MTRMWRTFIALGLCTGVLLVAGSVGVRKITEKQERDRIEDKVSERLSVVMNSLDTLRSGSSLLLRRTDFEELLASVSDRKSVV